MPTPFQVAQPDIAGGINQATNKGALAINECSDLLNFYPFGKRLIKRKGRGKVNTTAGSAVTGLFAEKVTDGAWTLLSGQPDHVSALSAGVLVPIPVADGHIYVSDALHNWRFRQYVDTVFAVRKFTGRVKAIRPGFMLDAGIRAPVGAPTLVQGANGVALDPGAYTGVYTFLNSSSGAESNPSPPSPAVGIAQGTMIQWSGFDVPTTPGVDTIRLYRSTVDATGQYYLVTSIPYPGPLTYLVDAVTTELLGQDVSLRNGLPPARSHLIEVFAERLWLSDGKELAFSEAGLPQSFFGTSVIDVNPDDGHDISGLYAWEDRLIVGKTNALYYITGDDPSNFALHVLSDRHGVAAPDSLKSVEGVLYWFDGFNVYRAQGGSAPQSISDQKVRAVLDSVASSQREFAVAAVYPLLCQYRLSVAANGGTAHDTELVYNYRDDAWTIFQYDGAAPRCYGDFYSADQQQLLYAGIGVDGFVYDLNSGNRDGTAKIPGTIKSRYFQSPLRSHYAEIYGSGGAEGKHGLQISLRRLALHCTSSIYPATVKLWLDSSDTPYKTRTVPLAEAKDWKPLNVSNLKQKASAFAWSLEHTGDDGFEVSGVELHGVLWERWGKVK